MTSNTSISIAIVGRPNVGKSTLFNRLIKQRKAIETDIAGTTRDRLYGDAVWGGRTYQVVDTAGILYQNRDELENEAHKSTQIAMEQSQIILFVVDFKSGPTDIDFEIAKTLRRCKKVILVINKCDTSFEDEKLVAFKRLGFSNMILVSAISGKNSGDLLDLISELAKDLNIVVKNEDPDLKQFKLSIIGRPNAGKSTLLNTIIGEEKMIVSNIPGTTRDPQEFVFDHGGNRITLIDTAGLRRKSKVPLGTPEGYALLKSFQTMREADMIIYLIDAEKGIVSIDQSLLGEAEKSGKSIILAVNKIDIWEDPESEMAKFLGILQNELNFMPWLPIIFISSKDKTNVNTLLNQAVKVIEERRVAIEQEVCDQILEEARDVNGQINYITALVFERSNPIVFKIRTKKNKKPHFSHLRYLENRIRDVYPLSGNPIFIDRMRKS